MGKYPDRSIYEMIREAGHAAIAEVGIDPNLITTAYVGNFNGQQLLGQGHFGPLVIETLGLSHVPAMRVEGAFALVAHRYFHEYRNVQREMAQVAVNAHDNALLNPTAQMHKAIDIEKVLNAPRIADPLGLYDCSLVTDGAAFMVLVSEELAAQLPDNGHRQVKIVGSGHGGDALTLHGKDSMTTFGATVRAAKQAYAEAGVQASDIDLAEVHDCFTITQIINTEDLGFFEKGHGGDAVAEGRTARTGDMPINVSGGLKAKGHPIGATGISQAFEVITQIRGGAGGRQINQADTGLTHNLGGTAGTCVINIFRGA